MKILVTGTKGQLGYDIAKILKDKYEVTSVDIEELDITNRSNVELFFSNQEFDSIIHCAAFTNVEEAEEKRKICFDVNVNGTKYLVEQAKKMNSSFIYFSTDYVFDGLKDNNENYSEDEVVNPINYYGLTKELGEQEVRNYEKHFILRISWVFGENGNNFTKIMLKLAKERKNLNVINDQIGSPTYTYDIANNIEQFLKSNKYGTYNFTNTNYTSWADYARLIFNLKEIDVKVFDISAVEYITKAKRPLNSKLSQEKLVSKGFKSLPSWDDAVKRYLNKIGEKI